MCICALASAAQDGSLPLHVAAANQASEAVVAALLKASPEAAKEKDKVRPPAHPFTLIVPLVAPLALLTRLLAVARCALPLSSPCAER